MSKIKIIQWVLVALMIVTIIAYPIFEDIYQTARQRGWTTHFSTNRYECDLSQADIIPNQQNTWVLGQGNCDFFDVIHVYDGESWTKMDIELEYSSSYEIDDQGQLWGLREYEDEEGSVFLEISKFDDEQWSTYVSVSEVALDDRFGNPGFIIDKLGQIWIPYSRLPSQAKPSLWTTGVSIFNGRTWETYNSDNTYALALERVSGPYFDDQNRAWFWSESGAISVFDGNTWLYRESGNQGNVISFAVDANGKAWIATSDGWIHSADGAEEINWNQGYRYLNQYAFDQSGRAWIAVSKSGSDGTLLVYDSNSWTTLNPENAGFSGGEIVDLEIDEAGNIWVGTATEISEFNPPDSGPLSPLEPDNPWSWLRNNRSLVIGKYWLLPSIIFLTWYALLFQRRQRLSAIGLLFGIIEMILMILALLFSTINLGIGPLSSELWMLMVPTGVSGLIISSIALIRIDKQDKKGRRPAKIGITLNTIGTVISIFLYLFLLFIVGY